MNSRWQANKIGLINFWYYDEQEFPFVKGRMLLRGSNGSGKSVTMQSVVPLLLDGNMSPERLDPFGSRDRKMSSYLLEEDDAREERTGYLYLEFCREESDTCLTIGMGIRARKGKPLDKWYFSLTDGRRVGKDFLLYKEMGEKITLSKKELENRIQDGGQVFDRQIEYMEYVNRQIFGFDTVEEYKEMIDLLIQLRTPKLSRDFKPSVINDILSESLQPLSDEDLRPMSEAIENMDTMNMNLKMQQEGKQAAEKIQKVFSRYNRLCLYEKVTNLEENRKKLLTLEQEEKERERTAVKCRSRVQQLGTEQKDLDARREAMEKERDSLSKSDAVGLKKRETELSESILDKEKLLAEKERQLSEKQEQRTEVQNREKEERDREYIKEKELKDLLEEMQDEAEEMCFEEHSFFRTELLERLGEDYPFVLHEKQMEKTRKGIQSGLEILRKVDYQQHQVEDLLQKRDRHQRELDQAEARVSETESVLVQARNEWKEALYRWNGSNVELKLSAELLQDFARFADSYEDASDFSVIRQKTADVCIEKKEALNAAFGKLREQIAGLEQVHQEKMKELAEWENHKEPEPFRSEAVLQNRERLVRLGIPYQEFYKVIEFGAGMDQTACDRLEEALLQMGILDALVIDESYRDQVLAMDGGCCDHYLFAQRGRAEKSLLDILDLNDSVNDIFFNQRIMGILENIAYEGEGLTSVSNEGYYQIGVLTGTITGEHKAGFLGTRAREKNRLGQIAVCRETLAMLEKELRIREEESEVLKKRLVQLNGEYQTLPGNEDLRVACRMLSQVNDRYERLKEEGLRLEEIWKKQVAQLKELQKEAMEIAGSLYLSCSYEVFLRADEASRLYTQHFYQVKHGYENFLQLTAHIRELKERLEDLEMDMDQIRYDMGKTAGHLKKDKEEYDSVQEQLKLTDYEEIRERLDQCLEWLNRYPETIKRITAELTRNEQKIQLLSDQLKQGKERIQEIQKKQEFLERSFEAEKKLEYVELPENTKENSSELQSYLAIDCASLSRETVIADLNRVYFENKGFLNDYQITQTVLFEELDGQAMRSLPPAKRLDIYARYQGVRIPFCSLIGHLEEDIRTLQELIRSGDRELFEDILANTVSRKIRGKINGSVAWVEKMNHLMSSMNTSSGLRLSLRWRSRTAEQEDQLDTKELVELLKKDYRLMREDEAEKLSMHFRSKVEEARRQVRDSGGMVSFYQMMKETLDYRRWFEFQLFYRKSGEKVKELTNSAFGTFSGGEKAMSMYVPLFSAVAAKYQGGRIDAPRLISLDEAFAGVDNRNIRDMFRLMAEFGFDFIINSQVLWGDCDTLDALAIYQLLRPENAKFVTVMSYFWNGKTKEMLEHEGEMEQRSAAFS